MRQKQKLETSNDWYSWGWNVFLGFVVGYGGALLVIQKAFKWSSAINVDMKVLMALGFGLLIAAIASYMGSTIWFVGSYLTRKEHRPTDIEKKVSSAIGMLGVILICAIALILFKNTHESQGSPRVVLYYVIFLLANSVYIYYCIKKQAIMTYFFVIRRDESPMLFYCYVGSNLLLVIMMLIASVTRIP